MSVDFALPQKSVTEKRTYYISIYLDTKTRESARRRATPRVEQSAFVLIVLFFFSVWEYNNLHIRNDGGERKRNRPTSRVRCLRDVLRPMRDVGDRGDQKERRERGRCSREIGEDDREERLCEFKVVVVLFG